MSPFEIAVIVLAVIVVLLVIAHLWHRDNSLARWKEIDKWCGSVAKAVNTISADVEELKPRHPGPNNSLKYEEAALLAAQIRVLTEPGPEEYWVFRIGLFAYLGGFPMHFVDWEESLPGYNSLLRNSGDENIRQYRELLVNALNGDTSIPNLFARMGTLLETGSVRTFAAAVRKWNRLGLSPKTIRWQDPLWHVVLEAAGTLGREGSNVHHRHSKIILLIEQWEKAIAQAQMTVAAPSDRPPSEVGVDTAEA